MNTAETILSTLEKLSERGWCVVLKKLPPKIGWLLEGSRSEYDAPCRDERVLPDTWACEAQFIGQTTPWMFQQHAYTKTPQEAVARVAKLCAGEERRTGRDTQIIGGERTPDAGGPTPGVGESNAAGQGAAKPYPAPACSASLVAQPPRDVSELYHELLYAVERCFPGESRHETALRYIRETERRVSEVGSCMPNAHALAEERSDDSQQRVVGNSGGPQ